MAKPCSDVAEENVPGATVTNPSTVVSPSSATARASAIVLISAPPGTGSEVSPHAASARAAMEQRKAERSGFIVSVRISIGRVSFRRERLRDRRHESR